MSDSESDLEHLKSSFKDRKVIEQPAPNRTIVCLTGKAGAGKDEVAGVLYREFDFARIALADPIKDFAAKMFGFSSEQLWGPSAMRNEVSPRWGLTPRHVLQVLGTEIGRQIHPEVWLRYCWERATAMVFEPNCSGVVVTDVRFANELDFFKARGAKLVKIVRPGQEKLEGEAGAHVSELEQDAMSDGVFDAVVTNAGTLDELHHQVREIATEFGLQRVEE